MDWLTAVVDVLKFIVDFIIHIDQHLKDLIAEYGSLTYLILFLIVFCETGLVVTPYLPGDSLLFAAGAFAGLGAFDPFLLSGLLFIAAVLGDTVNYWIARTVGQKILSSRYGSFIKPEYLERTNEFFAKHGGKTIILARFVPIVRTFAPFVAGIGHMDYRKFSYFNIMGAALWIGIFVPAGYFFGNTPIVQKNFTLVIFGVIAVSLLPLVFEFVRGRLSAASAK